ncbi:tyrosine-protein phosphatase non-receptor type 11-like isoform X2 [Dysidea avara]|uniref:tyrosine-protein phosphatase non-receptor type 11-like isoform X2 n=1 Tax=Dysidea avara TaxID=196820 RepID=UPI003326EFAB
MDRRCYHPHFSGAEAEQQLKTFGEHGSFLLRNSREDANTYTLSVLNDNEVIHLRMKCVRHQFNLCDGESFESPYDVIFYHLSNHGTLRDKSGRVYYLGKPLIRVLFSARWYHGDISPDEVEALLRGRGQDGSFLVRASYSSPGDYSLCVRLKDEVVSVKIYGRGEKFDLGGGRQFDNIEDLIMYYKKNPFNIVGGKQVHLHQGIECTPGSTSRQTGSTDGVAIGYYCRTIQRYTAPMFQQIEDGKQLQSGTQQELQNAASPWECKGTYMLNVICASDGKGDGMIEICDGKDGYTLSLRGTGQNVEKHGTRKNDDDDDGDDDDPSWFTLSMKTVYSPTSYTLLRLESNYHCGNFLSWVIDKQKQRIGFTLNLYGYWS